MDFPDDLDAHSAICKQGIFILYRQVGTFIVLGAVVLVRTGGRVPRVDSPKHVFMVSPWEPLLRLWIPMMRNFQTPFYPFFPLMCSL